MTYEAKKAMKMIFGLDHTDCQRFFCASLTRKSAVTGWNASMSDDAIADIDPFPQSNGKGYIIRVNRYDLCDREKENSDIRYLDRTN